MNYCRQQSPFPPKRTRYLWSNPLEKLLRRLLSQGVDLSLCSREHWRVTVYQLFLTPLMNISWRQVITQAISLFIAHPMIQKFHHCSSSKWNKHSLCADKMDTSAEEEVLSTKSRIWRTTPVRRKLLPQS